MFKYFNNILYQFFNQSYTYTVYDFLLNLLVVASSSLALIFPAMISFPLLTKYVKILPITLDLSKKKSLLMLLAMSGVLYIQLLANYLYIRSYYALYTPKCDKVQL